MPRVGPDRIGVACAVVDRDLESAAGLVHAGIAIEGWACYTLGMAKKREATRKPGRAASGKATVPAVSRAIDTRVDVL
jgi:hypothetical protein